MKEKKSIFVKRLEYKVSGIDRLDEMPNYQTGKVYKIESKTGQGKCYVGSTIKSLQERFINHKSDFRTNAIKKTTSMEIFQEFGIEGCQIVLLEEVKANTKAELLARETWWINTLRGTCVNKVKAFGTPQESCRKWLKANPGYTKQYYEQNKAIIMENVRKWNIEHPNERKEINRKASAVHYEKKREEVLQKARQRYQEKKQRILAEREAQQIE